MFGDRIAEVFFTLLQAGLWNKPLGSLDAFPLHDAEWAKVYQLAVDQTVEGVLFDGIQQLPSAYLPTKKILITWLVRVEKIEQRNKWMNNILAEQALFFEKANLHPLLLKGQGLAKCYENPLRRMCGDIDWYFSTKKTYNMAIAQVEAAGVAVSHSAGFSANYYWNACEVELHQKMFDIYNPFTWGYLNRFEGAQLVDGMSLSVGQAQVNLASPMVQSIQVNAHILKHLLSFGIGLRQLCDAARLYATYYQELDGDSLMQVYRRLKILKWMGLLHEILVKYIGLPAAMLPFNIVNATSADWMMEEILEAGNFGFYDNRYKQGEAGKLSTRTNANQRIWDNFKKYVPYAPMEAISFPMVHFYSRFAK